MRREILDWVVIRTISECLHLSPGNLYQPDPKLIYFFSSVPSLVLLSNDSSLQLVVLHELSDLSL